MNQIREELNSINPLRTGGLFIICAVLLLPESAQTFCLPTDVLDLCRGGDHQSITTDGFNLEFGPTPPSGADVLRDYASRAAVLPDLRDLPYNPTTDSMHHFDNNAFSLGLNYVENQWSTIALERSEITKLNPTTSSSQILNLNEQVFQHFGNILHADEDFYSHSNYVELWADQFKQDGKIPLWNREQPYDSRLLALDPQITSRTDDFHANGRLISGGYHTSLTPSHDALNKDSPIASRSPEGQKVASGVHAIYTWTDDLSHQLPKALGAVSTPSGGQITVRIDATRRDPLGGFTLWKYTVTNNSYSPSARGLTLFGLNFPEDLVGVDGLPYNSSPHATPAQFSLANSGIAPNQGLWYAFKPGVGAAVDGIFPGQSLEVSFETFGRRPELLTTASTTVGGEANAWYDSLGSFGSFGNGFYGPTLVPGALGGQAGDGLTYFDLARDLAVRQAAADFNRFLNLSVNDPISGYQYIQGILDDPQMVQGFRDAISRLDPQDINSWRSFDVLSRETTVTPEPSTIMLVSLCLAGLMLARSKAGDGNT